MDYIVREIKADEYPLLSDFLYEAIFIPDGVEPPPRSIVHSPKLQVYIAGFRILAETEEEYIMVVKF